MVEQAWDYHWASARHHVKSAPGILIGKSPWLKPSQREEYRRCLDERGKREEADRIRQTVQTGRPFGSLDFIDRLERKLERLLRPKRRGPEPKARQS